MGDTGRGASDTALPLTGLNVPDIRSAALGLMAPLLARAGRAMPAPEMSEPSDSVLFGTRSICGDAERGGSLDVGEASPDGALPGWASSFNRAARSASSARRRSGRV